MIGQSTHESMIDEVYEMCGVDAEEEGGSLHSGAHSASGSGGSATGPGGRGLSLSSFAAFIHYKEEENVNALQEAQQAKIRRRFTHAERAAATERNRRRMQDERERELRERAKEKVRVGTRREHICHLLRPPSTSPSNPRSCPNTSGRAPPNSTLPNPSTLSNPVHRLLSIGPFPQELSIAAAKIRKREKEGVMEREKEVVMHEREKESVEKVERVKLKQRVTVDNQKREAYVRRRAFLERRQLEERHVSGQYAQMEEEASARELAGTARVAREKQKVQQRCEIKARMLEAKRERVARNKARIVRMGLAPPS